MALTKTKFINYIRCPRYCALEEVKEHELNADVSLEEYLEEERLATLQEILGTMYDENGDSVIDVDDPQLKTMMPYYKEIELLAAKQVQKIFGGKPISAIDNRQQESFDFEEDGIKYLCYVDIYNENKPGFDIIEVKATTSKKFLELGPSTTDDFGDKQINSIFAKNRYGIYCLKEEIENYKLEDEMPLKKYQDNKNKLMDKYHSCGHYVYDLLVQRMIAENDLKQHGQPDKIDKIRYYLAVLNTEYIFNGNYDNNGHPIYETDENGNDIIVFFDFTQLTSSLMDKIELDRKKVVNYLQTMDIKPCTLDVHCQYKKTTKCKFLEPCFFQIVPKKNSVLNYMNASSGFTDEQGQKYSPYDLINDGIRNIMDVPVTWLKRENNLIQRQVVETQKPYVNEKKMIDGIKQLVYPLYHLDFETFPCPLPRFKGEKCYTQSVFQFSLHIERKPGICDKEKDHYEFLAHNHDDLRLLLVQKLCEYINPNQGMIIVYNQSFEKARLKELSNLFPDYKESLLKMANIIYDLMNIVKNNTTLYESLGYDKKEASTINYYHNSLNGSFSIKKVLPIFAPDLNYDKLEIGNGTEALVTYANFPNMSKSDFEFQYKSLLEYCKQDTWAMVIILDYLRKMVKQCQLT